MRPSSDLCIFEKQAFGAYSWGGTGSSGKFRLGGGMNLVPSKVQFCPTFVPWNQMAVQPAGHTKSSFPSESSRENTFMFDSSTTAIYM